MTISTTKLNIRYSLVKRTVNDVFLRYNINFYPIDIDALFSNFKDTVRVIPYTTHMNKYNLTEEEVISHFGSEEGCTIYKEKLNRYLIFYNDLDNVFKSPQRIRWTLIHELGHILLGHLKEIEDIKIFRNAISDIQYKTLEIEANRFSALLLAHPMILNTIGINNSIDIEKICNLSTEASKYRYTDYLKWCNYKTISLTERQIITNFENKIVCKTCKSAFKTTYNYCPICGESKIQKGVKNMIYDSIELNDKHKAIICPICENEHTNIEGDFCQICGHHITNMCANYDCGEYLDGESRYCPQCGYASTYLRDGILKDWSIIKQERDEEEDFLRYKSAQDTFSPINNEDDDPF